MQMRNVNTTVLSDSASLASMLLILCKYQIIIGRIEFHVYAYI